MTWIKKILIDARKILNREYIFFQYVSQIHKFHSIVLAWNPINIFSTTEQESKEWMLT